MSYWDDNTEMDPLWEAVRLCIAGFDPGFLLGLEHAPLAAVLRTVTEPWAYPGRTHLHRALLEASDVDLYRLVHILLGEAVGR